MSDQLHSNRPTAAATYDADRELDTVRAARAWLISAGAGDLTEEIAGYVAGGSARFSPDSS